MTSKRPKSLLVEQIRSVQVGLSLTSTWQYDVLNRRHLPELDALFASLEHRAFRADL